MIIILVIFSQSSDTTDINMQLQYICFIFPHYSYLIIHLLKEIGFSKSVPSLKHMKTTVKRNWKRLSMSWLTGPPLRNDWRKQSFYSLSNKGYLKKKIRTFAVLLWGLHCQPSLCYQALCSLHGTDLLWGTQLCCKYLLLSGHFLTRLA